MDVYLKCPGGNGYACDGCSHFNPHPKKKSCDQPAIGCGNCLPVKEEKVKTGKYSRGEQRGQSITRSQGGEQYGDKCSIDLRHRAGVELCLCYKRKTS